MKKLAFILPIALFAVSCGDGRDYEPTEYDLEIEEFLEDKDWETERTESGLWVYTEDPGSDEKPNSQSFLMLKYEGRLIDGTKFDGTDGQTVHFPFPVEGLIKGWQEGIPMFGKGGKGTLIIPPDLGYGSDDAAGGLIPGNSILVFDIEIVDFTEEPPAPQIDMSVDYSGDIDAYIAEQGLTDPIKTESGLYIFIEDAGSEEKPDLSHFLTLNYEGYLFDGSSFDGTGGTPTTFPFPLSNTIMGWQEGIPYFGKGGKGKLIIPPYIGYGPDDAAGGAIPGNSVLVFDIEILDWAETPPAP